MKSNIYDYFNDVKINFDDYDIEGFNDIEKKKIEKNFRKSLKSEKKKYMKVSVMTAIAVLCVFLIGTENGRYAIARIRTDITGLLRVEENIDNYKTEIGETAVDKNIEVKINDVMFDDENNLIVSREIKSDKKIKEFPYGTSEEIYINDKKAEFSWECMQDKIIDENSSASVDKYSVWSEDGTIDLSGDVNIKIIYTEVGEYPDYIKGKWGFEFNCDNIHNLDEVTKKGEVNYKFKVDNGGEISLNTYKINPLDMTIYGEMKGGNSQDPYIIELQGTDDEGNGVKFKLSGGGDHIEMSPIKWVKPEAKELKLIPYAMKFPNDDDKPMDMVKVGEEFTIKLNE